MSESLFQISKPSYLVTENVLKTLKYLKNPPHIDPFDGKDMNEFICFLYQQTFLFSEGIFSKHTNISKKSAPKLITQ